jgi:hypothetical protein
VLKFVLELIDRQFKSTRSRVIGWTLIVMTPFLLLGWVTERTLASSLLGLGIGAIVAALFVGFAVLTKVKGRLIGDGTRPHIFAAPVLFACYAALMLGAFGLLVLIAKLMGLKPEFQ